MNDKYEKPNIEIQKFEDINTAEVDNSLPGISTPDDEF